MYSTAQTQEWRHQRHTHEKGNHDTTTRPATARHPCNILVACKQEPRVRLSSRMMAEGRLTFRLPHVPVAHFLDSAPNLLRAQQFLGFASTISILSVSERPTLPERDRGEDRKAGGGESGGGGSPDDSRAGSCRPSTTTRTHEGG